MNHNDSSIPALANPLRRRFWQTLLTGCLLLLLSPAFAKPGPVVDKPISTGPPYTITFISFTNNQIANGIDQDEVVYQITDPGTGLPVSGEKVFFTTPSGTSKVTSDASGYVYFDLGNFSTTASVPVTVAYTGTPAPNSPFNFTWVPGPIDPTNPATQITVDKATAQPDGSDYTQVTVHLFDAYGNPISGASVTLTPSGSASGTAIISPALSGSSNAAGTYTLTIKNLHSGDVDFTATANGITITNGSPAITQFISTIPDPSNPATQVIVDVPTVQPDGTSVDVLHAHIVDNLGNPVVGATVAFTITGGSASGTAVVTVINAVTNSSGDAIINVSNTKAGEVDFTATVNGVAITHGTPTYPAQVFFVPTTPSTTNPTTAIIVDISPVQPDGTSQDILHAHIVDVNGNPIAGATVVFTKTGGSASGVAIVSGVTDNGNGNYTITVTSTVSGSVNFTATVNGSAITNGSPATVNFVATVPDPSNPATALFVDVTNQAPDGTSTDIIHAHVVGVNSNPVVGATVIFTPTGGNAAATAVVSSVVDNGNGDYTITIKNTKAGTVTFTATADGLAITNNSPATATFVATTPDVTNPATALIVDISPSPPDGTTADILHAHIVDANGNPVSGLNNVSFLMTGGSAAGAAVVSSITDLGNGDYQIKVTSTLAGSVTFTATVGGQSITNGSPATVNFVATIPDPANPLTAIIVDVPSAPDDGATTTQIHAHIVDATSNPVIGATVVFTATGGTAQATAVISGVVDNGNGNYTITITNTKPGTVTFTATVNGLNIPNGSPATVTFTNTPPNPANPATALIVDITNQPPDGASQDVIHAHVVDGGGNPITGATVIFTPTGGSAQATAVVSSVVDLGGGDYQITITNTKSGTVTFTATANGVAIVNGSPATATFVAVTPDPTNPLTAIIVDVPSAPDDGTTTTVIHAHLVDANGNPVPAATVVFTPTGGTAQATAVVSGVVADGNGNYTITITNTKPGTVTFTATANGLNIPNGSPATVTFTNTPPNPANPATALIVDITNQPPDGASQDVIHAHVVDGGGNPITGATVIFTPAGGSAQATAVVSSVVDLGGGDYQITITNTKSGTVNFTATANGVTITNGSPATATFVAVTPDPTNPLTAIIVDVPTAPDDGATTTQIHAHIVDANSNPVIGATVVFTPSGGSAQATAVVSGVVDNGNGNYTITITNTKPGTVNFTATVNGLNIPNGSPGIVTFTNTPPNPANPATALIVDITNQAPDGTSQDVIHAHIVDGGGNPITGATVVFTPAGGSAQATAVVSSVVDLGGGDYQITITNTKSGTVNFTATANGVTITNGSPATATFVAVTPDPTNPLTAIIVDVPTAPDDGATTTQIHAHIVDANSNPVIGATVVFTPSGGSAQATAVVSGVVDNGNGNYTITITNTKPGTVNFTATVNGLNIPNGSPGIVTFTNTPPNPANPATALIVDITNQAPDGVSQDVIHAHVVDGGGNPITGATVVFTPAGGSAQATAVVSSVVDLGGGDYQITITNTKSGTVDFTATANGVTITNGSPATATFVAVTPDPTNPATALIVDVPVAPNNGATPAVIHAHLVDANGNTVNSATVVFTPTGGTALATAVVSGVTSDGNGNYTITITNLNAGTVTFTATANGLPITNGSPATVTFSPSAPDPTNPATKLVVDITGLQPNGTDQDVIHAHVKAADGSDDLTANVVFTINGGTAQATAVVSSVTNNGNGDYTITITNTKSGSVSFTATADGIGIINGSPAVVTFVATTPDPTNPLTALIVDVPTAPDNGSTATVIRAHLVDANGNTVNNATVVFTPTGGTALGTAAITSVFNAGNGDYTITIKNTQPGTVTFTATANGLPITNGSPATVTFVTSAPDPTNPLTKLIVDVPAAPADGSITTVHAHVVDASGTAITNATIVFSISGGTAFGTAVLGPVTNLGNGDYSINITNLVAGTVDLTATANAIAIINGSPAQVAFISSLPSTGNPLTAIVVDIPSAPDDGNTTTVMHVHLAAADGSAVNGATVVFTPTGGTAQATAVVSSVVPDGNGNYTITIKNSQPGTVIFTATVFGTPITNGSPATVTFNPGTPSVSNPATAIIVDISGSIANGSTPDVIHAHIVDAGGTPLAGETVVFATSGGSVQSTAVLGTVTYLGNGDYAINITNTKAGTVTLTATVNGTPIVNGSPANITFVAGPPSPTGGKTLLTTIVDNNVADGKSTDSVKAFITDVNGNPVANTTVTFTIEAGGTAGTTATFMENVTVTTDANGVATIGISNTVAGTVNIGAYIGGTAITGTPDEITFVNAPDVTNPETKLVVIIYEALADGQSSTEVKAHIVDQNGNPISDRTIVFSIDSGSATFSTPNTVLTDNNGEAIVYLTSKTPGDVLITATVDGKPIIFGSPARVHFAPINIYVPRVFTPNNDGTNDILKPILVGISAFHYFSVYNRWGNLIFTTQDPNQGWDGTFRGVPQPVETYLWIGEGIDVNGKKIVQRGMVSLVR